MRIFDFSDAIVRTPGRSVVRGIRDDPKTVPDFDRVASEHRGYVNALRTVGLKVEVLPPLEAFPDSVFVEDPALVFPNGAILLRPGAPTRVGENEAIRSILKQRFETVLELAERECVDGGDVLVTPEMVYVGLSARTNREGAEALGKLLDHLGLNARMVETPKGVLHLKSGVALLDEETLLASAEIAQSGMFGGFEIIALAPGEECAANAVRIRDVVFVNAGFPRVVDRLVGKGFRVKPLQIPEVMKLDAGLSCMSLRWVDMR